MKPILALDVDGTTGGLHPEWLQRYNRDYNDTMTVSQIKAWEIHKFVKPECGKHIYDYLQDPSLYDNVKPIDGAVEYVDCLRPMYEIMHVTHATTGHKGRKLRWLMEHKLIMPGERYLEQENKSLVPADFLVDDYDKNVRDFRGNGNKGVGILFGQEWNKEFIELNRVDGWKELFYYLKDYAFFSKRKAFYVYALR